MSNISLYLKSHLFNSTLSAVDLAYKDPSLSNIFWARKLVDLKIKNTAITLNNQNDNFRCAQDKLNHYELLSKRLNAIEKIPKYQKEFKKGKLDEQSKENLINEAKRVAHLNDFRNKNFSNEMLDGAWFKNRDLRNADFCFLNMNKNSNTSVDFSGSNLSGVDFKCSLLNGSIFKGCDLTNATLNINNADFTNAKLNGVNLHFQINSFNRIESEYFLNEDVSDKTLFHTLNTISDKYKKIKIKLVKQLINAVANSVSMNIELFSIDSILSHITSKKFYLKDEDIKNFAEKLFYIKSFKEKDTLFSSKLSSGLLSFILDLISEFDNKKIEEHMVRKNDCFIKLMALTVYHNDLAIQKKGRCLYDKYLEIERIKNFVKNENFGTNKKIDWSDKENTNYIIIGGDKTIMISHEKLVDMLFFDGKKMDVSWNNFFLYVSDDCKSIDEINYFELFNKDFKIFKDTYNLALNKMKSDKLLVLLNLGDYHERFYDALIGKSIEINQKLINAEDQYELILIFSQLLVEDNNDENKTENKSENKKCIIEESHYQKISNAYGFELLTNEEQSQYLLSLAAIFVKFSSSSVFGTEFDSPQILRTYAYALMLKASELTPSLKNEKFEEWISQLLGRDNISIFESAFSCTNSIFSEMKDYGIKNFNDTFRNIVPLHWV